MLPWSPFSPLWPGLPGTPGVPRAFDRNVLPDEKGFTTDSYKSRSNLDAVEGGPGGPGGPGCPRSPYFRVKII